MDWVPRKIIRLNGMIKYGKTVAAPTTQFRNFMSASFFALANGHFDLTKTAKSISVMREYFTRDGDKGRLAYLRKLKQLGVVYDTPFAGEMAKLLEESKLLDIESREGGAIKEQCTAGSLRKGCTSLVTTSGRLLDTKTKSKTLSVRVCLRQRQR